MFDIILRVLMGIGIIIDILTFEFNSNTPIQLGRLPFFIGGIIAFACFVWLIARGFMGK